jgi:hypothetical protein
MTQVKAFKLAKIYILFLAGLFLFFFAGVTFAQEASPSSEPAVKKFNITFPIAELGNCSSVENCKEYCSDPSNQNACTAYAKKKGFYKESNSGEGNAKLREVIAKAKEELGCSTEKECKDFCSKSENRDKCIAFAQKYALKPLKSIVKNIVEMATKFLGCSSEDSCKSFCSVEANFEKCREFAKLAGLGRGKDSTGSGKPKEGTSSGKYTPNSQNAFEHANERARFCREYPEKCANSTGSGIPLKENFEKRIEQDKKKLEKRIEQEKKEFERREEKMKKEFEKSLEKREKEAEKEFISIDKEIENEIEDESEDEKEVQGISKSPSLVDKIVRFFFK